MFGLFKSKAPLSTFQRVDIELLMRKNVETLGEDVVRGCDTLVSIDEIPLDQTSSQTLAQSAIDFFSSRIGCSPDTVTLVISDEAKLHQFSTYTPADEERGASISIAVELLSDSLRTVMEIAYQLSTHYWTMRGDEMAIATHPRNTNLTPICLGLGVLASDACFYDQQWSQLGFTGWSMSRIGYYNAEEIGYALALMGRFHQVAKPRWLPYLRADSKVTARNAWKYFESRHREGRQNLFDSPRRPDSSCDFNELANSLNSEDESFALAAGYALGHKSDYPPAVTDALIKAISRRDPDVTTLAIRLLGKVRKAEPSMIEIVRKHITSNNAGIALAAVETAHQFGVDLKPFSAIIAKLLDSTGIQSLELLTVIHEQSDSLQSLQPILCESLAHAIRAVEDEWTTAILACLSVMSSDPETLIRKEIQSAEICEEAIARLEILTNGDRAD